MFSVQPQRLIFWNVLRSSGFWVQFIYTKKGPGVINKIDHKEYGEASGILDLMQLLSQKAPVYSLETKRSAIESVNQYEWMVKCDGCEEVDLAQNKCFNQKIVWGLRWTFYY